MKLAAIVAVVLLAACADPQPQNTDPGVATYAIDATGVHCNAPDSVTDFAPVQFGPTGGASTFVGYEHLCDWFCITYHGELQRMVRLVFGRPADELGNPVDKFGNPTAWIFVADTSEPSQYCPATTSP
jgi:hypothetical protein